MGRKLGHAESTPEADPAQIVPRVLRLSAEAASDIEDIQAWYCQPGAGVVAARRIRAILAAIRHLRSNPVDIPATNIPVRAAW